MTTGDVCKLRLEGIAQGGDAIGRIDGKTVFVEGGAPEETVLCRITEDRNTWAKAELLEIVEPSAVRTESVCAFYGKCAAKAASAAKAAAAKAVCGGCNLQHINYEAQLVLKVNILKDAFERVGCFCPAEPEVFSSPPWEYRNRMQFHCFRELAKNSDSPKYGLKGRRSGEIIAVNDCPVAVPGIREILSFSGSRERGKGLTLPVEKDRFTVFSKDDVLLSEGGQQRGKIKLLEKEIILDAGVFFQSNCCMLEKLILQLQRIALYADRNLPMADLYCGVGTFALFLSDMFPKIILAEENKNAVSLARENLKFNRADAEFHALRDTEWPGRIFNEKKTEFGFAVIDPPRAGLAPKLSASLAKNGPPVLAYVSCDPASLARDSKILTNGYYKLNELMLFDFYPQTAHIETLAVFTR